MAISQTDLMKITGSSWYEINRLLTSGILRTDQPDIGRSGQPFFSRDNALEICFVRAFEGCGVGLNDAAQAALIWIEEERRGEFTDYFAWRPSHGLYAGGDLWTHAFDDPKAPIDVIGSELGAFVPGYLDDGHVDGDMASTVIVIDRGRIVRRVDAIISSGAVLVRQSMPRKSAAGGR
jgi:hypothetical protein